VHVAKPGVLRRTQSNALRWVFCSGKRSAGMAERSCTRLQSGFSCGQEKLRCQKKNFRAFACKLLLKKVVSGLRGFNSLSLLRAQLFLEKLLTTFLKVFMSKYFERLGKRSLFLVYLVYW